MRHLNIFFVLLTLFITVNYCKSKSSVVTGKISNFINSRQISNRNDQIDIKCHYLNNIKTNINGIIEKKFKLTIYGRIVRFKNIPFKNHCNGSIVVVEIFATEKIIIDRNFNAKGKSLVFIVAAPIWHVIGKKVINLNGYRGKKRRRNYARNGNNTLKKMYGSNGKEGFPGGPGGQFQGIAGYIINKSGLKVHYNGGRGSNGQHGGNGAIGESGTEFDLNVNKIYANGFVPGFEVIVRSIEKYYNKNDGVNEPSISYYISEDVYGRWAQKGGNGGSGGPGGKGGLPGYYFLFDLNNSTCADNDVIRFVESRTGIHGADGVYGYGGHGGDNGRPGGDVSLILLVNDMKKVSILINRTFEHVHFKSPRGNDGVSGNEIIRKLQPVKHIHYQLFDTTERLYKNYLMSHTLELNTRNIGAVDHLLQMLQNAIIRCPFYQPSRINQDNVF